MRERLLDHHEIKAVEFLEPGGVGQSIGGIRVGHELDGGESLAHLGYDVHVPARLDLHLDALIARGQLALDFFEELGDRVLYTDRDTAGDFFARASADLLPKRLASEARFEVPDGGFKSTA